MMIEMKVKGLTLDPHTNVPIVVLRETEGDRALPIWWAFSRRTPSRARSRASRRRGR